MKKLSKIMSSLLAVVALTTSFSVQAVETSNHVYGSVGYSQIDSGSKNKGYDVTIGNRVNIGSNQAVRIEGNFGQTKKKNNVKIENYGVKANYEYAVPVSDNFYIIPNAGVGYREFKAKYDGAESASSLNKKVKSTYGTIGIRGQTQLGNVIVMPEIEYQKDFQTKTSGGLGSEKTKKGDGWKVGLTTSHETAHNYAVTLGIEHEEIKNKALSNEKIKKSTVKVGFDY